jgi:hypothetical protein
MFGWSMFGRLTFGRLTFNRKAVWIKLQTKLVDKQFLLGLDKVLGFFKKYEISEFTCTNI